MKTKYFLISMATIAVFLVAPSADAASRYGDAFLKKGGMTIVRNGQKMIFKDSSKPVEVVLNDVIWVHNGSQVVLETVEKATLTLGSNAAFQVKPWKSQGRKGFFRMLFGKIRAKVAKLQKGDRFHIKTASATIGVKGTEYIATVSPQGDAMLVVTESVVGLTGLTGTEQDVSQDLLAVVVNGKSATAPALVPDQIKREVVSTSLDSPFVNKEEARSLPSEEILVKYGIIQQKDLQEAKREKVNITDSIIVDEQVDLPRFRYQPNDELNQKFLEPWLFLNRDE